jgi:hypothetical protein
MRENGNVRKLAFPLLALFASLVALPSALPGQATEIPSWWFTAAPRAVLADPLFPTLPLTTRKQILSQVDPKFAKMKTDEQDRFLWNAETDFLPKAAKPRQVNMWRPTDSGCPSELRDVGWISPAITKCISVGGLVVQAAIERFSFIRAHVRLENGTPDSVIVKPQIFVLDALKPKRVTLFFEYPARVSHVFMDAALNYTTPGYVPTERTTVRSGVTGRAVATIDVPDPVARQDLKDATSSAVSGAIGYAATVESKSLKEAVLAPATSVEGDVWFESNDKAREVTLRVFISDSAFEIPFSLVKR